MSGALALTKEDELKEIVTKVKATERAMVSAIFNAGKALLRAKEIVGHGKFGTWLKTEFGASARTAQNYMRAFEAFGGKYETVAHLQPAIIYEIASLDPSVRGAIVQRIETGDGVNEALADAKKTRREAAEAAAAAKWKAEFKTREVERVEAQANAPAMPLQESLRAPKRAHAWEVARRAKEGSFADVADRAVAYLRDNLTKAQLEEFVGLFEKIRYSNGFHTALWRAGYFVHNIECGTPINPETGEVASVGMDGSRWVEKKGGRAA